jgi:hypothetical protein
MRRIRIAATGVMVAAGLIGAVAAPASAAPPIAPAKHLCEARGGSLVGSPDYYRCTFPVTTILSESDLAVPRRLCDHAYRGTFLLTALNEYSCMQL